MEEVVRHFTFLCLQTIGPYFTIGCRNLNLPQSKYQNTIVFTTCLDYVGYHRYFNIDIDLNYKLILFGIGSDPLLNLCLILMKRVIYNSKFKKQIPSFISFKCMVNFHYNLEKQIAMKCGTMYKFFKKIANWATPPKSNTITFVINFHVRNFLPQNHNYNQ